MNHPPKYTSPEYGPIMGLLLKTYKLTLSVVFQAVGIQCRHHPTCSEYCAQAVTRFGVWPGSWMGLARFCRCRPGGTKGFDPVLDEIPLNARFFLPWRYGQWGRQRSDGQQIDDN
ncbi:membrane protein insertion efficiency factor YidD [Hirschia litorea]|uniref:Putative membrane protein insertion efficiency factor n=1 Tax=Hirschia litorea TaxID=1199156 RepID=A0ABW2IKD4_9PROT